MFMVYPTFKLDFETREDYATNLIERQHYCA